MALSWSTIQSLLIFFGPMLLPRILAFYRSLRAPSTVSPIPLSFKSSLALNAILLSGLVALISTIPTFAPSNIFLQTSSRLQTPTNVLFTRLAGLHSLSSWEQSLREVFEQGGLEARLLYLRFGPDVLATCPFADPKASEASSTYLYYATPTILAPHVAHMLVLGLVTSASLTGADGGRFRTYAAITGVVLGATEFFMVSNYDHTVNAKATKIAEVDMFHWKVRVVRGLAIALVDAALGWLIWMSATKRAFVKPKSPAEKVEDITKTVEASLGKLRGLGAIRNVVYRNPGMRGNVERYWVQEERLMSQVLEDGDVRQAMNSAFDAADMVRLQQEAETYVDALLPAPAPHEPL
ncbi:hypothetical protein K461DRAFT_244380 [Myriangium duriaei CBS 260.36]|uniref:Uncharacterized protein n=1 Tax=Myriangium duriaei CBS 260.36 TaxID=1168546 RepID=A0A9P4IXW6_9PEZI|nr:hypothetical protein K461DRAFT_244380 [Myriangium duriaei CBS 260.36]